MDNSQTAREKDPRKDEPAENRNQTDPESGGYYYDDTTGYEVYEEDDDEADAEEDSASGS
jgi:hypothetical protein